MALNTAKNESADPAAPRADAPPELFNFEADFSILREESNSSGQECGQVLHAYMEQLSKAVPLAPEDEQELWKQLSGARKYCV